MAVAAEPVPAEQLIDRISQFNANAPDGSPVIVRLASGAEAKTVTRGAAFIFNDRPLIHLQGISGAVDLDQVRVTPFRRWVRLNRRGQTSHWIEGCWADRAEMEADIAEHRRRDPRIDSVETSNTRPGDLE